MRGGLSRPPYSATAICVRRKRSDDFTPPWSHRNHRGFSDMKHPLLRLLAPREPRKEHVRCQPAASQKPNPSYLSTAFVIPCEMPTEAIHVTKDHAGWRCSDIRRKGLMFGRSVSRRQDQPRRPAWARHDSRRRGRTVRWTLDCTSENRLLCPERQGQSTGKWSDIPVFSERDRRGGSERMMSSKADGSCSGFSPLRP